MSDARTGRGSRRGFLASIGAATSAGLVGCLGDGEEQERAEPYPQAAGPPEHDGWSVTFEDRFDEDELDTDRWSYGMGGGTKQCPPQEAPDHCWAADHVRVDPDTDRLRLEASETTPDGDAAYTMGAVCTDPQFQQEFGYFEASCRMASAPGTLPAFWLLSDFRDHRYRELTFETRGVEDGEAIHFGHLLQDEDGRLYGPAELEAGMGNSYTDFETPLDEAFHVLGIEWAPSYVAYHVDGELVERRSGPVVEELLPGAPMYPILNQGVFEAADWVGDPAAADFPAYHDVEWVRVWQRDDW